MAQVDDDRDAVQAPPTLELLKGTFVDAATITVDDWDDGEHLFDVILPPGSETPVAGDVAWILEDLDGEYPVVCWRRA